MKKVAFFIWTAGFSGLVPVAPGTAGSIVGLGLLMLVRTTRNDWMELLVLLIIVTVGTWSASLAERHYDREDPGEIVIDEVAGMMLTLLWLPDGKGRLSVIDQSNGPRNSSRSTRAENKKVFSELAESTLRAS